MSGERIEAEAQMFWLRRLHQRSDGRRYLSWHSYRTREQREKWAAIYRDRGDQVWLSLATSETVPAAQATVRLR